MDAQRTGGGASYDIKTKNLTRLVLRETEHAREIKIDGQTLKVKAGPEITLARNGSTWKVVKNGPERPACTRRTRCKAPSTTPSSIRS